MARRAEHEWAFINVEGHGATLSGGGAVWHPVTLDFAGPMTSETANDPNPFLDFRLNVTFTAPDGTMTTVPGFFAGDGKGGRRRGRLALPVQPRPGRDLELHRELPSRSRGRDQPLTNGGDSPLLRW